MRLLIAMLFVLILPGVARAQIDFEMPGPTPTVCDWDGGDDYTNYVGYNWSGFRPLSLTNYNTMCNPSHGSGYTTIPTNNNEYVAIGFGVSTITPTNPVRFLGMNAGAGWNPTSLNIEYLAGGVWNPLQVIDVSVGGYDRFMFNQVVEGLRFTPTWSSNVSQFGGVPYNTFYVDNLEFIADPLVTVPEPSTYALMGVGMATLFLARRRKQKI